MSEKARYVVDSPYLVPFDGRFKVADAPTKPPKDERKKKEKHAEGLAETVDSMRALQRALYAYDSHALLLVFQAMDAAGKDGTIRAVMSGIDPAGCQVSSFKAPSPEELEHDFLWRVVKALPERGRIGIFNRSHYEEVLVVRVHPEYLDGQRIPHRPKNAALFDERYDSIRNFERHLSRNGTVVVKFWLNVSRAEQRDRFLDRIEDEDAQWKFSAGDVRERGHWDAYMEAYEEALRETSRPWAPWYAIPADDKPFMRRTVADVVLGTLKKIDPRYPTLSEEDREEMRACARALENERGD
ncbi:MAG: PPK2 family polyphosphate kinase [Sandaracinaceae bacterium]